MTLPDGRRARLADLPLPDFGRPAAAPELATAVYAERLRRLRERMAARYDVLVVYADREHCANLAWLSGFDPRFEEAILIVGRDGEPLVLAGNECHGVAGIAPLPMRRELFQDLSLPSQPRDRSRALGEILRDEGVTSGRRIGVVGWKTFATPDRLDVPAWLADEIRAAAGASGRAENATGLFIDAADGLRVINEVDQLAVLEWASTRTSDGVRRVLTGLQPGMTEREAVALLGYDGTPLSCHVMLTAGPRARYGLLSPGDRAIERGDPFTTAFGIWGALDCRAGWVVEDAAQLDDGIRDYVDRLVAPYFEAVVEWLEALRVGVSAGKVAETVARRLADPFFGIFLNPGHQISLDEWVNSPFFPDSPIELRSGMAFQVDIIPATGTPYFTTNIEGGVALADESLRRELADRHPEVSARIDARRAYMHDRLGIRLHPDVLPLTNMPAHLPPFLLAPDRAMTVA